LKAEAISDKLNKRGGAEMTKGKKSRIRIEDIPRNRVISRKDMQKVMGGVSIFPGAYSTGAVSLGWPDVCFVPVKGTDTK
jgi:hypothetical protein